jgi:hypothetical protein
VEDNAKEVVLTVALILASALDHELLHVESLDWVMYWGVLLLILHLSFEPLKSDYQYRRKFEDLDPLDRLFVLLAFVTVPLVLPAQLLRSVELSEAVSDGDFVDKELSLFGLKTLYLLDLVLHLLQLYGADKSLKLVLPSHKQLVETPACVSIELYNQLEIYQIILLVLDLALLLFLCTLLFLWFARRLLGWLLRRWQLFLL